MKKVPLWILWILVETQELAHYAGYKIPQEVGVVRLFTYTYMYMYMYRYRYRYMYIYIYTHMFFSCGLGSQGFATSKMFLWDISFAGQLGVGPGSWRHLSGGAAQHWSVAGRRFFTVHYSISNYIQAQDMKVGGDWPCMLALWIQLCFKCKWSDEQSQLSPCLALDSEKKSSFFDLCSSILTWRVRECFSGCNCIFSIDVLFRNTDIGFTICGRFEMAPRFQGRAATGGVFGSVPVTVRSQRPGSGTAGVGTYVEFMLISKGWRGNQFVTSTILVVRNYSVKGAENHETPKTENLVAMEGLGLRSSCDAPWGEVVGQRVPWKT